MSPELEQVEAEIDEAVATSPLLSIGGTQAAWALLSVLEDQHCNNLMKRKPIEATYDNLLRGLSQPLHECLIKNYNSGGVCELDKLHHELAIEWIHRGQQYSAFALYFPLLRRKKIECTIAGNELVLHEEPCWDVRYSAYNLLYAQNYLLDEVEPGGTSLESYFNIVQQVIRINRGSRSFRVEPTRRSLAAIGEIARAQTKGMWTLPEHWKLGCFTLGQFRLIFEVLIGQATAWIAARIYCNIKIEHGFCSDSGVLAIERDNLLRVVRTATGIADNIIEEVIDLLTYGSSGIEQPSPRQQPIFKVSDALVLLSPIALMNSNAERNLCTLVNKVERYKAQYLALSTRKEELIRGDIVKKLEQRWRIGFGDISNTDVDLALIDDENRLCLCLELKWFIAPDSVSETYNRAQELSKGVHQVRAIVSAFATNSPQLLGKLKIDASYRMVGALCSYNWIGQSDMQVDDVPIIKVGHLLSHLREHGSLEQTCNWLEARGYLPELDQDFFTFEKTSTLADWTLRVPTLHPKPDAGGTGVDLPVPAQSAKLQPAQTPP